MAFNLQVSLSFGLDLSDKLKSTSFIFWDFCLKAPFTFTWNKNWEYWAKVYESNFRKSQIWGDKAIV